jgi:glycosyltransferase involved in cell wall biosynthesis
MRVALFTDGISPYVLGGMQRHSFFVCKFLAQAGIHVDLYHFNQSDYDIQKLEFFTDDEKRFIRNIVLEFPKTKYFPGHYLYGSWKYSEEIFKRFLQNGPVNFIYSKGFTAWYLLKNKHKLPFPCPPVGVKLHGMNMYQKPERFRDYPVQWMLRIPASYCMKKADYVFSYGGKITEIIRKAGVEPSKILEIPTGITEDWLRMPDEPQRPLKFLYVGRYDTIKGINEIYSCILSTPEESFEFHFIGPFDEDKKIKDKRAVYHGEIRDVERIKKIMDVCHVLVCPSYSEGMPNVILEGMSRGMAVFATQTGAIPLMADETNGWLISGPNINIMLPTFKKICKADFRELQEKRINSYDKIKRRFLWSTISKQLTDIIKKISLT